MAPGRFPRPSQPPSPVLCVIVPCGYSCSTPIFDKKPAVRALGDDRQDHDTDSKALLKPTPAKTSSLGVIYAPHMDKQEGFDANTRISTVCDFSASGRQRCAECAPPTDYTATPDLEARKAPCRYHVAAALLHLPPVHPLLAVTVSLCPIPGSGRH
ncbi:hypothetical protein DHEL01_v209218 [Diaporthe helianthi]|uniref:Uncharacterized protein n=1 Tax=Diaporthe helianthi TaxID=158607 RepID=A0A2P5HQ48_DIAHE|nr:hypothetical protein DHEL01_v209218 [Diaporthe helianthi]